MAVKVYGSAMSTCTARVLATLEEKGVDYELVPINFSTGEHKQPPHIHRNPFGQVPALEDGDLTLFESRAISKYVAHKHKGTGPDLLQYNSEKEAALVEVWLEVEAQQYNSVIHPIMYNAFIKPLFGMKSDETIIAASVETAAKVLDVYEERLTKSKYLAGDFFSLADLHHLPHSYYLMATPYASLINSRAHVKAWWEDLLSRPACKKVTDGMDATIAAIKGAAAGK